MERAQAGDREASEQLARGAARIVVRDAGVALVVKEGTFDEIGAARRLFQVLDSGS